VGGGALEEMGGGVFAEEGRERELRGNSSASCPGVTQAQPGKMMEVCGEWRYQLTCRFNGKLF
jgi:hypothetical protein